MISPFKVIDALNERLKASQFYLVASKEDALEDALAGPAPYGAELEVSRPGTAHWIAASDGGKPWMFWGVEGGSIHRGDVVRHEPVLTEGD